jgi:UDP-N-acetylglucosamine 2-epimerase
MHILHVVGARPNLFLTPSGGGNQNLAREGAPAKKVRLVGNVMIDTLVRLLPKMRVPCLTVRENTERPVTVTLGTNILVGRDMQRLQAEMARILEGGAKHGQVPPLWNGQTAERIANILLP